MKLKISILIHYFLIISFILLNILDFFNLLAPDLDYVKKLISWTLLICVFYSINFTRMIFGFDDKRINSILITSFILLAFNKFIAILSFSEKGPLFRDLLNLIANNAGIIAHFTFYMGAVSLLLLCVYAAWKTDIKKGSILGMLHESGKRPSNLIHIFFRSLIILLVIAVFYQLLFDPILEWLAIIIDSSLVVLGLIVYSYYCLRKNKIKIHERLHLGKIIDSVSDIGENIYLKFVSLFYKKKTVLLGFLGILVLHLIIDLSSIFLHYIFPFYKSFYIKVLGGMITENIFSLMIAAFADSMLTGILSSFVYIISSFGMLLLLITPAYLWYNYAIHKKIHISKNWICILLSSAAALIISRVYSIAAIKSSMLTGVIIQTSTAQNIALSLMIPAIVYALSYLLFNKIRRILSLTSLIVINLFLGLYVSLFILSVFYYYTTSIISLLMNNNYLIASYVLFFFVVNILFYFFGFIYFIIITIKESLTSSIT